eukprot:COSAG01_NODE_1989_length_8706_cov_7.443476_9_plen_129_part_01
MRHAALAGFLNARGRMGCVCAGRVTAVGRATVVDNAHGGGGQVFVPLATRARADSTAQFGQPFFQLRSQCCFERRRRRLLTQVVVAPVLSVGQLVRVDHRRFEVQIQQGVKGLTPWDISMARLWEGRPC